MKGGYILNIVLDSSIDTDKKKKVNTSLLTEGAVVKNYKEMCGILGCEPCNGGNDKVSQIKNWKRYFNFEKQGHKFIITEIYDNPLPCQDSRSCREGIYVKYIESLLLRLLADQKNNHLDIVKRNLYSILGITSIQFFDLRSKEKRNTFIDEMKDKSSVPIDKISVLNFKMRVEAKISQILSTALKSMSKRNLIEYRTNDMISYKEDDGYIKDVIKASEIESDILSDIREEVLEEMEYSSVLKVIWDDKINEFNSRVLSSVQHQNKFKDVDNIFTQLSITATGQGVQLQSDIKDLPYTVQRQQLNRAVIDALNTQAVNLYEKHDGWGTIAKNTTTHYDDKYVVTQKELSNYLLDINNGDKYNNMWKEFDKNDIPDNKLDGNVNK